MKAFFSGLAHKKDVIEVDKAATFNDLFIRKQLLSQQLPDILSTGGYNNDFLKLIANEFNTKVIKCHEYLQFVINAIDYCDQNTNDCFFRLVGPQMCKINSAGKIDLSKGPPK